MEAVSLRVDPTITIGRHLQIAEPLSQTLMTFHKDGRLELAPDATPRDVAEALADAYSTLHQEDRQTIERLTRLLSECREVLASMGLRTANRTFWRNLNTALGLDPTDIDPHRPTEGTP